MVASMSQIQKQLMQQHNEVQRRLDTHPDSHIPSETLTFHSTKLIKYAEICAWTIAQSSIVCITELTAMADAKAVRLRWMPLKLCTHHTHNNNANYKGRMYF